jgi:hypothetical protein
VGGAAGMSFSTFMDDRLLIVAVIYLGLRSVPSPGKL